jgi:putative oxidoreductase
LGDLKKLHYIDEQVGILSTSVLQWNFPRLTPFHSTRLARGRYKQMRIRSSLSGTGWFDWTLLIARVFIASAFFLSAVWKATSFDHSVNEMLMQGILNAPVFLLIALVIEFVCSICVLGGVLYRAATLMLFLYLIPVTLTMHDFWNVQSGDHYEQISCFIRNLAVMGGLLMAWYTGAGGMTLQRLVAGEQQRQRPNPSIDKSL